MSKAFLKSIKTAITTFFLFMLSRISAISLKMVSGVPCCFLNVLKISCSIGKVMDLIDTDIVNEEEKYLVCGW